MSFSVKGKEFLKKCNKIWEKVSNIIKTKFSIELLFDKKYLKAEENLWSKNPHERMLSVYLYISDIDWFSLYKK